MFEHLKSCSGVMLVCINVLNGLIGLGICSYMVDVTRDDEWRNNYYIDILGSFDSEGKILLQSLNERAFVDVMVAAADQMCPPEYPEDLTHLRHLAGFAPLLRLSLAERWE